MTVREGYKAIICHSNYSVYSLRLCCYYEYIVIITSLSRKMNTVLLGALVVCLACAINAAPSEYFRDSYIQPYDHIARKQEFLTMVSNLKKRKLEMADQHQDQRNQEIASMVTDLKRKKLDLALAKKQAKLLKKAEKRNYLNFA